MTWDADINPEGVAEQWKHTFTFNFGGGGVEQAQQSYAKDSKNLAITKTSEPWKLKVDLFANFAQFVYDDVTRRTRSGRRERPMAISCQLPTPGC